MIYHCAGGFSKPCRNSVPSEGDLCKLHKSIDHARRVCEAGGCKPSCTRGGCENHEPRCPDCGGYHDAPNLVPLYSAATGERSGEDWCEHDIHEPARLARLAEEEETTA